MDLQLKTCSKQSTVRTNPCLKSTMEKLNENREKTGDIKFIIDGEVIPAHRCVLAALSPKYEAQFYGLMPENDTIHVSDVSPAAFKEFLQFFYVDEVTLTLDNIEDVLNLAKQSLVDELVAECINYLIDLVGLDKVVLGYRLALVHEIKELEMFYMRKIGANVKSVFKTVDFLNCERDMLHQVLAIESLNCNHIDIFDACIAWARAQCKRDGIDTTDAANLRVVLDEALFKVRFCSMNIDEFAAIDKKYSGLLLANESKEIFHAIVSKANSMPMKLNVQPPPHGTNTKQCKIIQSNLECLFSTGKRAAIHLLISDLQKRITFKCNHNIQLNGLVLCNRIDDDVTVAINMLGEMTQMPKSTTAVSDNETIIAFDQPVIIKNCLWCHIRIESKAFHQTDSHFYGFQTEKCIERHGVSFEFLSFECENLNLITRFLFDTIDTC